MHILSQLLRSFGHDLVYRRPVLSSFARRLLRLGIFAILGYRTGGIDRCMDDPTDEGVLLRLAIKVFPRLK